MQDRCERSALGQAARSVVICFGVTVFPLVAAIAVAASAVRSFRPSVDEIFIISSQSVVYTCGFLERWHPGKLNIRSGIFTPTEVTIRDKNKQLKRQSGAKKRKTKQSLALDKKYLRLGTPLCQNGPSSGMTPTPTAVPTVPGGSTPTPTPTPSTWCFQSNGDANPGCFGIPAPLVGNKIRGEAYYTTNCTGCHSPVANESYSHVYERLSTVPQMQPFRPDNDQDIADIVAYINRFTL
jgi:hypothetical protein